MNIAMHADEQAIVTRLEGYRARIEKMLQIIGNQNRLKLGSRGILNQQMRSLKDDLKEEESNMKFVSGYRALTQAERAFYHPAVEGIVSQLTFRWDSNPIKSNWSQGLQKAKEVIDEALRQVRAADSEQEESSS